MNAKTQERLARVRENYIQAGNRLSEAAQAINRSHSGFSVSPWALSDDEALAQIAIARALLEQNKNRLEELESAIGEYEIARQNQGPALYLEHLRNQV